MLIGLVELDADVISLSIYTYDGSALRLILNHKAFSGLLGLAAADMLSAKGITKACAALRQIKRILDDFGIARTCAVARAALGSLLNIDALLMEAQVLTGLAFTLLSGEEEARLGFSGAREAVAGASGVFVDISGGSTNFIAFTNGLADRTVSLPYGPLNLSLKYIRSTTPHKSNILDIKQELKRALKRTHLFDQVEPIELVAAGDTAVAAGLLYNDVFDVQGDGNRMEADKLLSLLTLYNENRRDVLFRLKQLAPDGTQTVIPGIAILHTAVLMSRCSLLTVSRAGVREGYLLERLAEGR